MIVYHVYIVFIHSDSESWYADSALVSRIGRVRVVLFYQARKDNLNVKSIMSRVPHASPWSILPF